MFCETTGIRVHNEFNCQESACDLLYNSSHCSVLTRGPCLNRSILDLLDNTLRVWCNHGRDSVVVSSPDSQFGGPGFDPGSARAHQAYYPFGIGKWVPISTGVNGSANLNQA